MWDLSGPGLEPMSPALGGGFLTTVPPGKSQGGGKVSILHSKWKMMTLEKCRKLNKNNANARETTKKGTLKNIR